MHLELEITCKNLESQAFIKSIQIGTGAVQEREALAKIANNLNLINHVFFEKGIGLQPIAL